YVVARCGRGPERGEPSGRIVGKRNLIEQLDRHRVESAGRNLAIGGRLIVGRIDGSRIGTREVSTPFGGGCREGRRRRLVLARADALVRAKVEEPVLEDGAPERAAELVVTQLRLS